MKFFHILLVACLLAMAERALGIEGSLYMWGSNDNGQLGNGNTNDTSSPVLVSMSGKTWMSISLGTTHTGGITSDGALYMWGSNNDGRLGLGTVDTMTSSPFLMSVITKTWKAIALGFSHTGAITTDGALYMWGANGDGQLGNSNSTVTSSNVPIPISVAGITWAAIALGDFHTGALTTNGSLYMWGYNCNGQLGNGNTTDSLVPLLIAVAGKLWAALALGEFFSGAVSTDGGLYMWGHNYYGQLGNGGTTDSNVPVPISVGGAMVAAVSLGGYFTAAKTRDGALYLWGNNQNGQLGRGDMNASNTSVLLPMQTKAWATVVLGDYYSGAITNYTIPSMGPSASTSMSPMMSTSVSTSAVPSASALVSPSPARSPNPSQSPNPSPSPTTKQNSTASPSPSSGVVNHYTLVTIIVTVSLWAMALM